MASTIVNLPRLPAPAAELSQRKVLQARAARILAREIDFIPGIPYELLTEQPFCEQQYTAATRFTAADEVRLFRQLNLVRYRAARLRCGLSREAPDSAVVDEIERLLARADQIRNRLAIVFSKLTLSIARRFADARSPLDELASEGQIALLAAIAHFDPERGFRFSTYATHALRRRLLRHLRRRQRERDTFVGWPYEGQLTDQRRWTLDYQRRVSAALAQLEPLLCQLPPRERYILRSRFGWGREFEPRTLQDIAHELGISRERVRQLESRSLAKLRHRAAEEGIEV